MKSTVTAMRSIAAILALAAIAVCPAFTQSEADFTVLLTADGTGAIITEYTGSQMAVIIPATIQGMPVREIGSIPKGWQDSYAVFSEKRITSVVIPNGVTLIGTAAFSGCRQLTQVTIPNSVTRIGRQAFFTCASLKSITLPDSITEIGDSVFYGTGLTSITWPKGLTAIPNQMFYRCENLANVSFHEGLATIGEGAFASCKALISVTLPASIKRIEREAFAYCSALTTVTIPETVEGLSIAKEEYGEGGSFIGCPKLTLASQAAIRKWIGGNHPQDK